MIFVNRAHHSRPRLQNNQIAFGCPFQNIPFIINKGWLHTKERQGRRTRFGGGCTRERGNHMTTCFCLPPCINNRATFIANDFMIPKPCFVINRLTHCCTRLTISDRIEEKREIRSGFAKTKIVPNIMTLINGSRKLIKNRQ